MRSKLATVISGLACAAAIVPAVALGAPSAQASLAARPAASVVHSAANTTQYSRTTFTSSPNIGADAQEGRTPEKLIGSKTFTPQSNTFSATDADGRFEAAYNYRTSPGTFSWRYEVNRALCAGGEGAVATADIYNNGGLVPGTHYSKLGVTPCYGFHAAFENAKINTKGKYQLRGTVRWRDGDATFTLTFRFNFLISDV